MAMSGWGQSVSALVGEFLLLMFLLFLFLLLLFLFLLLSPLVLRRPLLTHRLIHCYPNFRNKSCLPSNNH